MISVTPIQIEKCEAAREDIRETWKHLRRNVALTSGITQFVNALIETVPVKEGNEEETGDGDQKV